MDGVSSKQLEGPSRCVEGSSELVVGSNTDIIAGEGQIVTYGGFDTHVNSFHLQI